MAAIAGGQPGGMDGGEVAGIIKLSQGRRGGMQAEIDPRRRTVGQGEAVFDHPQVGRPRGDEIGIIGWRNQVEAIAAAA